MSQVSSSSSSEMDFRAAVLSGFSGGRDLRESSVSSEDSVDSDSSPVSGAPASASPSPPRARPRDWSAAVGPAAAAAAMAEPSQQRPATVASVGVRHTLRSVVVRPPEQASSRPPPGSP
ncbi:Os06g0609001 [Oryza sativa Japonica Group]|uniref:Os06g0609001 protein n=2 Tax=Oryza sativa TaxID=4530 RepID=A0A0N7KME1_ORYSJ|nr:hypothetical protein OsI_23664 [Oryza sativa Indica Group]BAS98561.1 Os06g0609001 [Oryza sativa Japonica Group]